MPTKPQPIKKTTDGNTPNRWSFIKSSRDKLDDEKKQGSATATNKNVDKQSHTDNLCEAEPDINKIIVPK